MAWDNNLPLFCDDNKPILHNKNKKNAEYKACTFEFKNMYSPPYFSSKYSFINYL